MSGRPQEPQSGSGYTRVLAGQTLEQTLMNLVVGVAAIFVAYIIIFPSLGGVITYFGWLARGKPGDYQTYSTAALSFQYPEGMVAAFISIAVFIPLALLMMRFVHQRRTVWLSSVQPGMRWRYLFVVAVAAAIVLNVVYWLTSGRTDFHWAPAPRVWLWLAMIIVLGPLQAAGEEYMFRGYLMQVIGSAIKQPWIVVGVSGVVFAAVHGTQNLPLLLDRFAFGAVMGALVVLTGGLEAAIATHAVNNVFAFGYAALSGGVASARTLTEVSWATAGTNIVAYLVIGVIAWRVGVMMKVAVKSA